MADQLSQRLARRLKELRLETGRTLDELARASGVSRSTLSRLENGEVSPTTENLSQLCSAYGLTLTKLLSSVEQNFQPLVTRAEQTLWHDAKAGFVRRSVSPPSGALAGEVIECTIEPGSRLFYRAPPVQGLEHHLVMLKGRLQVVIEGEAHKLSAGDCLRYRLFGSSEFTTTKGSSAHYMLVLV